MAPGPRHADGEGLAALPLPLIQPDANDGTCAMDRVQNCSKPH